MIKFVCSSCGERLSVPDQHSGRRGVCPNCHAINRIPLKGMPAAQSAKPADSQAQRAVSAPEIESGPGGSHSPQALPRSAANIGTSAIGHQHEHAPTSARVPSSISTPTGNGASRSGAERFTSPTKVIPEPDQQAALRSARRSALAAPAEHEEPAELVELTKERRLPKPVKMALLIIAALVLVSALYFGLRFALNAALRSMQ